MMVVSQLEGEHIDLQVEEKMGIDEMTGVHLVMTGIEEMIGVHLVMIETEEMIEDTIGIGEMIGALLDMIGIDEMTEGMSGEMTEAMTGIDEMTGAPHPDMIVTGKMTE